MSRYISLFLFISSLLYMGLVSGCSESDDNKAKNTNTHSGFQFGCEFGSSDGCIILDDDGYQFTDEGEIYDIEESTQGSEPECGQSPCFNGDKRSLTINRNLIGTYTYDGASITINLPAKSPNWQICDENVIWEISDDLFENQSSCLSFESSFVKRYKGEVTIN